MAKSISIDHDQRLQHDTRNNSLLAWVFEHVEEQKEQTAVVHRMPYQQLLRTVGAWLDTNLACNVNLIETSTGLIVRYGVGDDPLLLRNLILTHAELEHLEAAMKERRSIHPSGHYQNFLRALGYEIDAQAGAYIVLDQIDENLFLTFCRQGNGGGLGWVKHARVLNSNDQTAILRRAYARRKVPEVRKHFWQRILRRQGTLAHSGEAA